MITETLSKAVDLELEAIEARRGELEHELQELTAYRDDLAAFIERRRNGKAASAKTGVGSVLAERSGAKPTRKAEPKPKAVPAEQREARASAKRDRAAQVVQLAIDRGEITAADVERELGISRQGANHLLKRCTTQHLAGGGQPPLCVAGGSGHKGDPKRYAPRQAAITKADTDGAKTDVERRVVSALRGGTLTTGGIEKIAGVGSSSIGPILNALTRRGVVRPLPNGDGSTRWELTS